jgi:PKD repeat protein
MKHALMVALLGLPLCAGAANEDRVLWSRTFGGASADGGRWVCETTDGSILIVGYTYSFGAGDVDLYAVKADGSGNELWSQSFGGAGRDYGYGGCETDDGGYLLVGYTTSYGSGGKDIYLVKTDSDGNELWSRTLGGPSSDVGRAVIAAGDGSYVICGHTESAGAGEHDIYLVKVDSQGQELWDATYGGTESEWGMSLCETDDGGYVVTGPTGSSATGNRDPYLLKTDSDGIEIWMRYYGTAPDYELGYDICRGGDGGYVIVGHSDTHLSDLMKVDLYRTDAQGNQEWRRTFGEGTFYDYGKAVCPGDGGGFVLCGATKVAATAENDVYLIATDSQGHTLWLCSADLSGSEWGCDVCPAQQGYLVCGHTKGGGAGSFDVLLIKVSNLLPKFGAVPVSGHAPLEVHFTDESLGDVTGWRWDLDGDGIVDSEQQNPAWTYDRPGTYDVTLEVTAGTHSQSLVREAYIRVFDGESALQFDGDVSYVECPASPSLNLTDALTVEAWIDPSWWGESGSGGYGRIVDKTNFALYLNGEGSTFAPHSLVLMLKNETGPPKLMWTPDSSIVLGNWQHVAASYEAGTGRVRMYVDGIEQTLSQTNTPSGLIKDNADEPLVVGNAIGTSFTFDGTIDELRIWSAVRSPEDIAAHKDQYLDGSEEDLVGLWSMNEGYGDTICDVTSHHNDGVISGAQWAQGAPLAPPTPAADHVLHDAFGGRFALARGYPNPFATQVTIEFFAPSMTSIHLAVYNLSGRCLRTLLDKVTQPGVHTITWDGRAESGGKLPAGAYFYRLTAADFTQTRPCLIVR